MTVTVYMFDQTNLPFDLDTVRPLFASPTERDDWFRRQSNLVFAPAINWNDMMSGSFLTNLDLYKAMRSNIGWMEDPDRTIALPGGSTRIYFKVTGVRNNGAGRVIIDFVIDWELTICHEYTNARITRVPAGDALEIPSVSPIKFWKVGSSAGVDTVTEGVNLVAVSLTQFKFKKSTEPDVSTGPVFLVMSVNFDNLAERPMKQTIAEVLIEAGHIIAATDIIGAWILPSMGDPIGRIIASQRWYGYDLSTYGETPTITTMFATSSPTAVTFDSASPSAMRIATNLRACEMGVFIDWNGNIIHTVQDRVDVEGHRIKVRYSLGMTACEVTIAYGLSSESFEDAQAVGRSFSVSCVPLDIIADSWQEYAARQRQADIEARKLQNDQALVQGVSNIVAGAGAGALMGSVVPGVGNAVGALVGAAGGIAQTVTTFGTSSVFGEREQSIQDRTAKLQQDIVAVVGGLSGPALNASAMIRQVQLVADDTSVESADTKAALVGVPADQYVTNLKEWMTSVVPVGFENAVPIAAEVDIMGVIPKPYRDSIRETMASGARWARLY